MDGNLPFSSAFLSLHNLFSHLHTVCYVYVKIEDIYENPSFEDCIVVGAVQVIESLKSWRVYL